jgi:hypothetical protein
MLPVLPGAGEAAGSASTKLVANFGEPLGPDASMDALRPFSMTGSERIRADSVVVTKSKEKSKK